MNDQRPEGHRPQRWEKDGVTLGPDGAVWAGRPARRLRVEFDYVSPEPGDVVILERGRE